jgi:hypothetical protein
MVRSRRYARRLSLNITDGIIDHLMRMRPERVPITRIESLFKPWLDVLHKQRAHHPIWNPGVDFERAISSAVISSSMDSKSGDER